MAACDGRFEIVSAYQLRPRAAASVMLWPASESRARLPAHQPQAASMITKATVATTAAAMTRGETSGASCAWLCECAWAWGIESRSAARGGLLRCEIAAAGPHQERAVANLDTDGMPAAVVGTPARVPQIVLLAELVGDPAGRRVEVARIADQLGEAAAVVGDLTQCLEVDGLAERR